MILKAFNFCRGLLAFPFLGLEWLAYRIADFCADTSGALLRRVKGEKE